MSCSYVIRTGLNFGADYCAYQSLPSECHSEMCVTVVDAVRANDKITSSEMSNGALCTGNSESSVCAEGTNSLGTRMDELEWKHVTTLTRLIPVRLLLLLLLFYYCHESAALIICSYLCENKVYFDWRTLLLSSLLLKVLLIIELFENRIRT